MTDDALRTARERLEAGDHAAAREAALAALEGSPDDVEALRVAGRAGVELGSDDAVELLRRVSELAPGDAASWHDLGDALAAEGRTDEAHAAFERALQIDPEDPVALAQVGHAAAATGRRDDAISYLSRAAERGVAGGASSAVISLVDMHRAVGDLDSALAVARQALEARPDDVVAAIDVADLAFRLGRHDEAEAAFERLREIDEVAEHETYALHGLAQVALARDDAPAALALAEQALAIDERGRSADLVLHLQVETGQELLAGRASSVLARVPPTREELEQALLDGLAEHRRLHADDSPSPGEEAPDR